MRNDIERKVHESALKRRAGWLEIRMLDDGATGKHYDRAEYAALMWAMSALGISYEAGEACEAGEADARAGARAERAARAARAAPAAPAAACRKTARPRARPARGEELPDVYTVPAEPRGRRYYPGGL